MFNNLIKKPKEKAPLYFGTGNRYLNILHTKLRNSCSGLYSDLIRVGLVNSPKCTCSSPLENSHHFLLDCPLYNNQRHVLFQSIYQNFMMIRIHLPLLLKGSSNLTEIENTNLFLMIQNYLKDTNRF